MDYVRIFANSHYVTPKPTIKKAISHIKEDLKKQLQNFEVENKLLEKQRLHERGLDIHPRGIAQDCACFDARAEGNVLVQLMQV